MSRTLVLIIVLCQPLCAPSQSFIEEAVTGLLGRTAKIGRNFADLARGRDPPPQQAGLFQGLIGPQPQPQSGIILRPEDGTVVGGLFRGLMQDVDETGNLNKRGLMHPDQHQLVGGIIGGLFNGKVATTTTPAPKVVEDVPGLLESMVKRRTQARSLQTDGPSPINLPLTTQPPPPPPLLAPPAVPQTSSLTPLEAPPHGELEALRRDVQRDAPECSQKARAQLSKVLASFRKGVLDCVGVDDTDLGDVLNRLRQVLLTADRLPTSLMHKLGQCSALSAANKNETSSAITKIPRKGKDPGELSAARCILQALAEARDRLHKIPSETAAFSRRVAFLLAGTKSDARVRACVASQLTSMAHPIVATARQMAGCVMVGPDFSTE